VKTNNDLTAFRDILTLWQQWHL